MVETSARVTSKRLVTVAIPTIGRSALLLETVKCVLRQSHQTLDILISDNGSPDGALADVRELAATDLRVRMRRNPSMVPLSSHLNQCLDEARGEWFVIVSDDDLVSDNFVESLVGLFEKQDSATVGLTRCVVIDYDGIPRAHLPCPQRTSHDGLAFAMNWLCGGPEVPAATYLSMFMRTAVARAVGGFPDFPQAANADNALFLALALRGDIVFAADATFFYRVYSTSTGLSMPHRQLAESANRFRRVVTREEPFRQPLSHRTRAERRALSRALSRMLAQQYIGRLHIPRAPSILDRTLWAAVMAYHADAQFVRQLIAVVCQTVWTRARRRLPHGDGFTSPTI